MLLLLHRRRPRGSSAVAVIWWQPKPDGPGQQHQVTQDVDAGKVDVHAEGFFRRNLEDGPAAIAVRKRRRQHPPRSRRNPLRGWHLGRRQRVAGNMVALMDGGGDKEVQQGCYYDPMQVMSWHLDGGETIKASLSN